MERTIKQIVEILEASRIYEKLGVEELVPVLVDQSVDDAVSLVVDFRDIKVTNQCSGLTVLADSLLRNFSSI